MCIDFKDLNKACPKDCYPLPEIDSKVDSLAPYRLKCFLDAYKGYHQKQMAPEDEAKTTFITDEGVFCYTKMPFGLKHAGVTYQRLMDKVFHEQIGKKYGCICGWPFHQEQEREDHVGWYCEDLPNLKEKLKPGKCSFGVEEGKFLGVVVTKEGVQANPDKVQAVIKMPSPKTLKDV
jgi:hypothetical protein